MKHLFAIAFCLLCVNAFSQPKKEIEKQIDSLTIFIRNKATESFALNSAYQGSNMSRKWKDVYDPTNADELKAAKQLLEQMKKALNSCNYKEFDTFRTDKQSEGTWYVYTYACGSRQKIHMAFLRIKGKYVLGDIDVEGDDDHE